MKKISEEKGFIKTLFALLLLGAIMVSLILFGKPYYRSYTLGAHTRDYLKTEIGDIAKIRSNVMKDAAELGIKLNEANLSVTIDNKIVKVKATWKDTADFWGYYQKTFDFEM
ncbi:MAG: hypothetical protein Q8K68_11300, partial [Nitrospirota bacterium]|nr:hypothetical protein [Nitrospirota bacterium]